MLTEQEIERLMDKCQKVALKYYVDINLMEVINLAEAGLELREELEKIDLDPCNCEPGGCSCESGERRHEEAVAFLLNEFDAKIK